MHCPSILLFLFLDRTQVVSYPVNVHRCVYWGDDTIMELLDGLRTITRKDIAREAGVTETIVSYVINGNRYVKEEKRKRVEEAIAKLNYRPNTMARALKGKKSNHILFIADDIQGEYFGKLISEIDSLAYKHDYFITLCADHRDEDFVNRIYSKFFDGIVIGSATFPLSNIQRLIDAHIPIVLLEIRDYHTIEGTFGLINTGLYEGAKAIVRLLSEHGRKRLLFLDRISSDGKGSDLSDWRLKGFSQECERLHLEMQVVTGCRSEEEMAQKVRDLLATGFVPDGLVGRNDQTALVGMQTCKRLGYSIPSDMACVGFDNSRLCRFSEPTLCSMEIQQKEIAKAVMHMLMHLMDHPQDGGHLEEHLSTRLVMRESV